METWKPQCFQTFDAKKMYVPEVKVEDTRVQGCENSQANDSFDSDHSPEKPKHNTKDLSAKYQIGYPFMSNENNKKVIFHRIGSL